MICFPETGKDISVNQKKGHQVEYCLYTGKSDVSAFKGQEIQFSYTLVSVDSAPNIFSNHDFVTDIQVGCPFQCLWRQGYMFHIVEKVSVDPVNMGDLLYSGLLLLLSTMKSTCQPSTEHRHLTCFRSTKDGHSWNTVKYEVIQIEVSLNNSYGQESGQVSWLSKMYPET
jgi:hypothetical protein